MGQTIDDGPRLEKMDRSYRQNRLRKDDFALRRP